jgi:hypothetical protein
LSPVSWGETRGEQQAALERSGAKRWWIT